MAAWWMVILTIICVYIADNDVVLGDRNSKFVCDDPLKDTKKYISNKLTLLKARVVQLLSSPPVHNIPLLPLTEASLQTHFMEMVQFKSSTYLLSKYRATPFSANFLCSAYGGYLVEVNNQEELDAVLKLDKKYNISGTHIGVNDIRNDGQWTFSYSGAPAFTKFHSSEPNGWTGQNCVYFAHGWGMSDIECDRKVPFICEIPITK